MKKLIIVLISILVMIFFTSSHVIAQEKVYKPLPKMTVEQTAERQANWMSKKFKLDDKTAKLVYSIQLKYLIQTDSIVAMTKSYPEKRTDHGLIFINKSAELKTILTPEQYDQYLAIFDSRRDKVQLTK